MILSAKTYNDLDYVKIPFQTSMTYSILIILESILNAFIPSLQILVTAKFLDTALDILKSGGRERIYLPLLLLVLLVSVSWISKMLIGFVNTRLKMRLSEDFRRGGLPSFRRYGPDLGYHKELYKFHRDS